MELNFKDIDKKWQYYWAQHKTYAALNDTNLPKYYVMDMFPYPSGTGLHVGHSFGYVASDIYCRYKRMRGYNVLHPMGYDAFGLPAEQYAIETGQHPAVTTEKNIRRYRYQLDLIGLGIDWDRQIITSDPAYYKWTQWLFLLFYNTWYNPITNKGEDIITLKNILAREGNKNLISRYNSCVKDISATDWNEMSVAEQDKLLMEYRMMYRGDSYVWYCEALGCVLANDEVKDGVSERGGYAVERRLMRQWFQRISSYSERLLQGLERIDWSDSIKEIQRNWIGKSEGAEIDFFIENSNEKIKVFTTRPDTLFGVSFIVLAPEHEIVLDITTMDQQSAVQEYLKYVKSRSERDRMADVKKITGQFTGTYAIHPITKDRIPIWVAEYVLSGYGTGAIMAVPGGDTRDWEFAKFFGLPIIAIIADSDISMSASTDKMGTLINSEFLNGLSVSESINIMLDYLDKKKLGKRKVNFKMRDAGFARQRYWGEPFPILYQDDNIIIDPHLPVKLPQVQSYVSEGTGASPLANITDWVTVGNCTRETDTMPGNAGSSWYFLRYMDPNNELQFASQEAISYWQQVDLYIGGAEHATGHLLYARLWTKILYDLGYLPFDEPFQKLINQGMILGENGEKMSKRLGNTVNPEDIVLQYGADCFRMYEMFLGPIEDSKPWNTKGIEGVSRFLRKLWNIFFDDHDNFYLDDKTPNLEELRILHRCIKKTTDDIERFSFNTNISGFMIVVNELNQIKCNKKAIWSEIIKLMAPFAPHITEELWQLMGNTTSIVHATWPAFNPEYIKESSFNYPVAINGKTKFEINLSLDLSNEEIEKQILLMPNVQFILNKNSPKKIIIVKGRMINIVI